MAQEGGVYAVTVLLQELVHPFPSVTVTVKVPPAETVTHCVVAPVLHKYPLFVAAHNCVELPEQKLPPVIEQVGGVYAITVLLQELEQPY